jgi:predicted ester cyclase
MEQSLAHAQEKIVKLELEVEQMRTALRLIYEISQDRITPVWEIIEHIAATANHALNRNAG